MVRVWVAVKLCDPLITHGLYLGALEIKGLYIKRYINPSVYFFLAITTTTTIIIIIIIKIRVNVVSCYEITALYGILIVRLW